MIEPYHLKSEVSQPKVVDVFARLSLVFDGHFPFHYLGYKSPPAHPLLSRAWAFQGTSFDPELAISFPCHLVKRARNPRL